MKSRRRVSSTVGCLAMKFRLILPLIYFVLALLPLGGMIVTIAEGPNPFGFLWFLSMPGFIVAEGMNRVFGIVPATYEIIVLLVGMLINIGAYFGLGYLIDFVLNRRRKPLT